MITADHIRLYRQGVPFFPSILSEDSSLDLPADAALISLACRPESDLKWEHAIKRAQECQARGKLILWHFDFGLEELNAHSESEAVFLSYTVAIDAFVQNLWPLFKEQTLGACIYKHEVGRAAFDELDFKRWAEDLRVDLPEPFHERLYSCRVLSELLHRLISFFPDSVIPFACIDLNQTKSAADQALMTAMLRLEHLHLCFKGAKIPLSRMIWEESGGLSCISEGDAETAVCVPENFNCQKALDALLTSLQADQVKFRIIAESRLTEEWDGIETLIVLSEWMSPLGKRKLKGFEAAGGEIISWVKKES